MTLRINHYPKYAAVVDIPEGGCRTLCGKPRSSSLEYVLGGIGPNFSVPAIRTEVKFWTRCIAIASYSHTLKRVQYFKIHKEWRC